MNLVRPMGGPFVPWQADSYSRDRVRRAMSFLVSRARSSRLSGEVHGRASLPVALAATTTTKESKH